MAQQKKPAFRGSRSRLMPGFVGFYRCLTLELGPARRATEFDHVVRLSGQAVTGREAVFR